MHGTAGRMTLNDTGSIGGAKIEYLIVAQYDKSEMPAVVMFNDRSCSRNPARFSLEPGVESVAMYDSEDIEKQMKNFGSKGASSILSSERSFLVPVGYELEFFEKSNF